MLYVGIDVAKDKHGYFITNSDGEVLFKSFSISNNREGFETLFRRIKSVSDDLTKVSLSLRKTKTDKVDSRTIATMMIAGINLKTYSDKSYRNEELQSLTCYRFHKKPAKLKTCLRSPWN